MCGIAGFCSFYQNYKEHPAYWYRLLASMGKTIGHRGPDETGQVLFRNAGLVHKRLSIIDLTSGTQPMYSQYKNRRASIVLNGEIYNMKERKQELLQKGMEFQTTSDTEVVLKGYLYEGIDYIKALRGIFALAIWDDYEKRLYLARDPMGVKPLFYSMVNHTLVFASELKGLLAYPGLTPVADKKTLLDLLAIGPGKSIGHGIFQSISELRPGEVLCYQHSSMTLHTFWQLTSQPHRESWTETVAHTGELLMDSCRAQMLSDVPVCTFLSGGIDSSLVTAICAREYAREGKTLDTYSFSFQDNEAYFQKNAFQPSLDQPYVSIMAEELHTNHHTLECSRADLLEYLYYAVDARDCPCMADIDGSMLYFCSLVAREQKVALTGECADELFGGYPWYTRNTTSQEHFPWSLDFAPRMCLLRDDLLKKLPLEEYGREVYQNAIRDIPYLDGEEPEQRNHRTMLYLNIRWFMQTLLDRMDRCSMQYGLEARVPFADLPLVEYLWNVPWSMKYHNQVPKALLRESCVGLLPESIRLRKKSPYPKTYDPAYEAMLKERLSHLLLETDAPIGEFLDKRKFLAYLETPSDYGKPFYGQLMAGPQLLAYYIQFNYWLEKYQPILVY